VAQPQGARARRADGSDVGRPSARRPETGCTPADLILVLEDFARALNQLHGKALRPLMTQRPRHPELLEEVYRLVVKPWLDLILDIIRAGVHRGEVNSSAATLAIASVGPRLIISLHMEKGSVGRDDVEWIVEEVLKPVLRGGRAS